jgi:hypothetical protein
MNFAQADSMYYLLAIAYVTFGAWAVFTLWLMFKSSGPLPKWLDLGLDDNQPSAVKPAEAPAKERGKFSA